MFTKEKKKQVGIPLTVQWLDLGELGWIPGWGTKVLKASHNGQKRERERKEAFEKAAG